MTRRHPASAAGAAIAAAVALAAPAAATPDRVTRFGYDHCAAAEVAVPVPRERAARFVPAPFVPTLFGADDDGGTPMVDAFLRLVRCHDAQGRRVRTMWLGLSVRQAHPRDLRSSVLWRLATDDVELHRVLRAAVPSPRVVLVPPGDFGAAFEELLPVDVGVPVLTDFEGRVAGTADDLALEWTVPSPHPALYLPELTRGLRFAWYAPTPFGLRRILTIVPQHGGGDLDDPLQVEDPPVGFHVGPAQGRLIAGRGTWLASLLGPEAARDEHGDVEAPVTSRHLHVRSHRAEGCVEPVVELADASRC